MRDGTHKSSAHKQSEANTDNKMEQPLPQQADVTTEQPSTSRET